MAEERSRFRKKHISDGAYLAGWLAGGSISERRFTYTKGIFPAIKVGVFLHTHTRIYCYVNGSKLRVFLCRIDTGGGVEMMMMVMYVCVLELGRGFEI